MWCKWMLNVGVNQTLAVYNDVFRRVHQEGEARETLKAAMREVLALSQKEGTGLTEQDFRDYLQIIDELNPDGMPSMRQDQAGKTPDRGRFLCRNGHPKSRETCFTGACEPQTLR